VRRMLLFILVLGLVGTGAELVLLEHYGDPWQVTPLALIGVALLVLAWHTVTRGPASIRALQAVMTLFLAAGVVGVWLHYKGNTEFELEADPTLTGFQLFKESLAGAMPTLAPGTMIELGLIGLVYSYRHPRSGIGDRGSGIGRDMNTTE
jgi:NO-binding membrane sensor protein with MHYT domain